MASPFFGIPFATKDMIDIAGVATTAGSRVLRDNVATSDAAVISRLFAARRSRPWQDQPA